MQHAGREAPVITILLFYYYANICRPRTTAQLALQRRRLKGCSPGTKITEEHIRAENISATTTVNVVRVGMWRRPLIQA